MSLALPGRMIAPHPCHRGDEAAAISAFKDALGLSDENAAPVHIDVGRRMMRSRAEAASRSGSSESFRALQKLIYVSELVLGARKVGMQNSGTAWGHERQHRCTE